MLCISVIQVRIDQGLAVKIDVPWGPDNQKTKDFIIFLQIQAEPASEVQ